MLTYWLIYYFNILIMNRKDIEKKLKNLNYEKFKKLAINKSLSKYEKIGFYNEVREGKEEIIFKDVCDKLPAINQVNKKILDIGSGCSDLPKLLIDKCRRNNHELYLIDSKEMLNELPDDNCIHKIFGMFPYELEEFIDENKSQIDCILVYSVFQYIVQEVGLLKFIDNLLTLMSNGGYCLIGDIPNISKRNRFFSSLKGKQFHNKSNMINSKPDLSWNEIQNFEIDDSVILSLLMRVRSSGFEAYLVPQPEILPMANRREDILIIRH